MYKIFKQSDYVGTKIIILITVIAGILIIGSIYLFSHLLIAYGVQKERKAKECLTPTEATHLESLVEINQAITTELVASHDEYKFQSEKILSTCETEAKKQRTNFLWCNNKLNKE